MKILVAVDPNVNNDELLAHAAGRMWPAGSEVCVVSVVEPMPSEWVIDADRDLADKHLAHGMGQAEAAAERLRGAGLVAKPFVFEGVPASTLVTRAFEWKVDLILLGPPGKGTAWPHLKGATARRVLRHAHCSTAIVRSISSGRVLVATDGSADSEKATAAIASRPWGEGTQFLVASVVEPISASLKFFNPAYMDSAEATDLRARAMSRAELGVERATETLRNAGLAVDEKVLVPVESAQSLIMEEAQEWGAGLIVVGSHGRSGIERFLIGSVSESVAMHAGCSVEVIR